MTDEQGEFCSGGPKYNRNRRRPPTRWIQQDDIRRIQVKLNTGGPKQGRWDRHARTLRTEVDIKGCMMMLLLPFTFWQKRMSDADFIWR